MLHKTTTQQIPSTCFGIKFDNFHDYLLVKKHLDIPYYQDLEEFDIFCFEAANLYIDVEVADSYVKTLVDDLKDIKGLESNFAMATDLTKAPEYTFTTDGQVIEAKRNTEPKKYY